MAEYLLLQSFQIDDGQLDGKTPQECFVLGWELADVCAKADANPAEFEMLIHADNIDRITEALDRRGRPRIVTWMKNDVSEGWVQLVVMKKVGSK